jgi:hypothetical protein
VCGINGETKTSRVSFSSSLLAYSINSAAAASSRASLFHVPLQLLLELVSLSLRHVHLQLLPGGRERRRMNRIRGHEIDEEPALIEFSLYACSSGRIPRGHGQAPHAGDLPFVANATPTTAAAQCKDPLPMIIHHPAIYFPLLLVAEPEEKDGLVPLLLAPYPPPRVKKPARVGRNRVLSLVSERPH